MVLANYKWNVLRRKSHLSRWLAGSYKNVRFRAVQGATFRCNMWMLLIVKLLSFKRYNYPFNKCRESGRQMQCAYSQPVSDKVVPLLFSLFGKILETNAMHCFSASSVSCVTERLSGCKDTDLYWIRANYYLKKYYSTHYCPIKKGNSIFETVEL